MRDQGWAKVQAEAQATASTRESRRDAPAVGTRSADSAGTRPSSIAAGCSSILDHPLDDLVEVDARRISNHAMDLLDVRYPSGHVLERLVEHLVVRREADRRLAVRQGLDLLGQLENADFRAVADVEDLADRSWLVHRSSIADTTSPTHVKLRV